MVEEESRNLDWQKKESECKTRLIKYINADEVYFKEKFNTKALEFIRKGQTKNRRNRLWFDKDYQEVIAVRREALRRFNGTPTTHNLIRVQTPQSTGSQDN